MPTFEELMASPTVESIEPTFEQLMASPTLEDVPDKTIDFDGVTVNVPANYSDDESGFSKSIEIDEEDSSGFFGLSNITKGAHASGVNFGTAGGVMALQAGELLGEKRRGGDLATDIFLNIALQEPSAHPISKGINAGVSLFSTIAAHMGADENLQKVGNRIVKGNEKYIRDNNLMPDEGTMGKVLYDIGGVTTSIVASVGVTLATKNPTYAALIFGILQDADIYQEAREGGKTPSEAAAIALEAGVAEAALEQIGGGVFLKLGQSANAFTRILGRTVEEALQESLQQGAEEIITSKEDIRSDDYMEKLKRVGYAAFLGSIGGGSVSVSIESAVKVGEKLGITKNQAEAVANSIVENKQELTQAMTDQLEAENSDVSNQYKGDGVKAVNELAAEFEATGKIDKKHYQDVIDAKNALKKAVRSKESRAKTAFGRVKELTGGIAEIEKIAKDLIGQVADSGKATEITNALLTLQSAKKLKKPQTLTQFIKSKGGIDVSINEVIDAPRGLIRGGARSVDSIREAAEEEGFLLEGSTEADLINLLNEDIATQSVFREGEGIDFVASLDAINQVEEFFSDIAINEKDAKKVAKLQKRIDTLRDRLTVRSELLTDLEAQIKQEKAGVELTEKIVKRRKEQAKKLREQTAKLLKNTKTIKRSGKPIGKYTPDVQRIFDAVREKALQPVGEARKELLLTPITDVTTPMDAVERLALKYAANEMALAEQIRFFDYLTDVRGFGINKRYSQDMERQLGYAQAKDEAVSVITGDGSAKEITERTLFGRLRTVGKSFFSWQSMMDVLSFYDKSPAGESRLSQLASVSEATNKERAGLHKNQEKVIDAAMRIYGITKPRLWMKKNIDDAKPDVITYTDSKGETATLELSRQQARKRWMELQDPTLRDTIFSKQGNAYTKETVDALNQYLTKEDKQFAQWQLDFYKSYYGGINEVYGRVYGADLPFNEKYSPITRDKLADQNMEAPSFMDEWQARHSVTSGSLKSRKSNISPLINQSDVQVLGKHIKEMEHFKAWAEKVRMLNAVFGNQKIRSDIKKFHRGSLQIIDKFIEDFASGGRSTSNEIERTMETFRTNFAVSALAIKPAIGIKQLASIPAYAETLTTKEFTSGVAEAIANPKKAMEALSDSVLLQARGTTFMTELSGLNLPEGEARGLIEKMNIGTVNVMGSNLANAMLLSVRLGDKGAIIVGGYAVYKAARNKGMSHKDAIKEFERVTAQTQQSTDLQQLSTWQRHSFLRLATMFLSAPNQYFNRVMMAVRNAANGRMPPKQVAKIAIIYHFLLPTLFQFIANGFEWDDKDQARAAMLGSFNGVFIFGDLYSALISVFLEDDVYLRGTKFDQITSQIGAAATDIRDEDWVEAFRHIGEALGPLSGLPEKQAVNLSKGVSDMSSGDVERGIYKIMGWSEKVVEEQK